jgi:hypothetical protein
MEEPYGEGVATHTGPESCVGAREGFGEALIGVRAGRVLSRENGERLRSADAVGRGGRQHLARRERERCQGTARSVDLEHVRKHLARESGDPTSGPERWRQGPRREP